MKPKLIKAIGISLWFCFLIAPFVGLKIGRFDKVVSYQFDRVLILTGICFTITVLFLNRKTPLDKFNKLTSNLKTKIPKSLFSESNKKAYILLLLLICFMLPQVVALYQVTALTTALIFVGSALGLNIVVGLAGLLDLGYVAFFAVGAYTYGLMDVNFGFGFWTILPFCGLFAALFGIVLGIPVLRLRGDYLAIVTLGFGEIIRIILKNWDFLTNGNRGISNIAKPAFFNIKLNYEQSNIYLYYLVLLMCILAVFVIVRLNKSHIGRAWVALREDEIACSAMGLNTTKIKLSAFGLGACWAGFMGSLYAAKTTFINPDAFSFHESAMLLSIVVLEGMGSITGVIIAALLLVLIPEYLRAFSEYRMLIFGAVMVLMMLFKPQGLIANKRYQYKIKRLKNTMATQNIQEIKMIENLSALYHQAGHVLVGCYFKLTPKSVKIGSINGADIKRGSVEFTDSLPDNKAPLVAISGFIATEVYSRKNDLPPPSDEFSFDDLKAINQFFNDKPDKIRDKYIEVFMVRVTEIISQNYTQLEYIVNEFAGSKLIEGEHLNSICSNLNLEKVELNSELV